MRRLYKKKNSLLGWIVKKFKEEDSWKYHELRNRFPEDYNELEKLTDMYIREALTEIDEQGEILWHEDVVKKKLRPEQDSYFVIKANNYRKILEKYNGGENEKQKKRFNRAGRFT